MDNDFMVKIESGGSKRYRSLLVLTFYLILMIMVGAIVPILETGSVRLRWWLLYIPLFIIVSFPRIYHRLLEPRVITIYKDHINLSITVIKHNYDWMVLKDNVLVTCIGYDRESPKRRVVIRDKKNIRHHCSLDRSTGWDNELQEVVIAHLKKSGINIDGIG